MTLEDAPDLTTDASPATASAAEPAALIVATDQIHVLDGFNPRRFFLDAAFQRLKTSIETHGIVTPLTVRVRDQGGYWLIAGERRLRCVRELGITSVPVLVRDVTEAEARMLAVIENADRADLSIADEILSIQQLLDAYEGDVEGVAAALGWKPERVKHRLKLMQACSEVIEALANDAIRLGHVELLATLPQDAQIKVLAKVIESGASVTDLKAQLEAFSQPLARAIFDKSDCRLCPHNSSLQQGLFADSLSTDRCTNRTCYSAKTTEALDAKREQARESYATVAFKSQQAPGSSIPLTIEGPGGVTRSQADACRACKHFGVVIDDRPGATVGAVSGPTCFNLPCNAEKVAEAVEARRPAASPEAAAPPVPASTSAAPKPAREGGATGKATPPPATPTVAATPKAVEVAVDRMQRRAVSAALAQQPAILLALAIYGMHRLRTSDAPSAKDAGLAGLGLPSLGSDVKSVLKLVKADPALLRQGLLLQAQAIIGDHVDAPQFGHSALNRRTLAAGLAKTFAIDAAPFVVIDKDFLTAHTKAGIEAVLAESGFADWFRAKDADKGEKLYKALLAKGKGELIDAVLAAGFDFSGYVPSSLKALS